MHVVIIRTSSLIIDLKTYNCQEIGLAIALIKKGYKVSFITPGVKQEHIKIPVTDNMSLDIYTMVFFKLNRNICWYHNYFQLLEKINPDLLHINSISLSMSFFTQLWAERHYKKTVVIQGNYKVTQKPVLKQLEHLFNFTLGKYIIHHTAAIGCKTNWAADFIKKYSPKTKTYLTRIGLDTSRFIHAREINWREKLHFDNKKILLYIGAIESRRNPLFLLDLLKSLPDDYCLIFVGTGSREEEVKCRARLLALEKRCFFLGKLLQSDLPSLYKTANLFLLPSSYEIFGMVILESMYFGTPVITTLTAGSDAIISNGYNGVIINNLNLEQWKLTIISLIENTEKLVSMSVLAKQTIENHLVWDKAVNEFIDLYNNALKNGK